MKEWIIAGISLVLFFILSYLMTPRITYITLNGEKIVIDDNGKEVYRPLTKNDYMNSVVVEK